MEPNLFADRVFYPPPPGAPGQRLIYDGDSLGARRLIVRAK